MKVLITGACGQLGHELLGILNSGKTEIGAISPLYKGAEVVAVDVDDLDITNQGAVSTFVDAQRPDVIINCAAMTNVDACEGDKHAALRVNSIGVRNVAMAAQSVNAKLLHVSTDYVFSGDADSPYCEWDATAPKTVYGKSKLMGEGFAQRFCDRTFVIRTAWLYGYHGNNFVKTILKNVGEKGSLKVVNDQRGNPTHANDLAHHILKLALTEEYGVYHCTGNGECSWYDFAVKIVELAGIPGKISPCTTEEFPRPAPRPAYSSLQNMMLSCTVGDEMRQWETALASYFKQTRTR
ncbi:MAG: dTDP-4-dehydrorhamnose reductase [Treponema sp.]|nr:dTDP-4-dehydrorhamnose reductase [Treponema sp.]